MADQTTAEVLRKIIAEINAKTPKNSDGGYENHGNTLSFSRKSVVGIISKYIKKSGRMEGRNGEQDENIPPDAEEN